jgi:L-alanine-DL-glutamate epimerase-like enolase superfamily enzyme
MSASTPPLTIRALRATAVDVPMTYALGTSRARITSAPWADKIVQQPLRIVDGCAMPSDRPGNGLVWVATAVEHYRLG